MANIKKLIKDLGLDKSIQAEIEDYMENHSLPRDYMIYPCESGTDIQIWTRHHMPPFLADMIKNEVTRTAMLQMGPKVMRQHPNQLIAGFTQDEFAAMKERVAEMARNKIIAFMKACRMSIFPTSIESVDGKTYRGHEATMLPLEQVSSKSLLEAGWGRMVMIFDNCAQASKFACLLDAVVNAKMTQEVMKDAMVSMIDNIYERVTIADPEDGYSPEIANIVRERMVKKIRPDELKRDFEKGNLAFCDYKALHHMYDGIHEKYPDQNQADRINFGASVAHFAQDYIGQAIRRIMEDDGPQLDGNPAMNASMTEKLRHMLEHGKEGGGGPDDPEYKVH